MRVRNPDTGFFSSFQSEKEEDGTSSQSCNTSIYIETVD
jgi:hypothetical protein